ncbi:MAG: divalent-cation tolerance protein CutA [Gemmatimonadetes bacterium]|nr:divalent-cation tolerance protein CutA [Gemmatimonadota bacterium]
MNKPSTVSTADAHGAFCIALVTVPGEDVARTMARALIEQRVAACVNSVSSVHSTYRWEGEIEEAEETLLLIKTTVARKDDLVRAVEKLHPYDEPEVIFVPIEGGRSSYLTWIRDSVSTLS